MRARTDYLQAQTFEAPSIKQTQIKKIQSSKDEEEDSLNFRTNIMFDNRVCRGNTYSNPVITENQKRNLSLLREFARQRTRRRRQTTPPPVRGRIHAETQTHGSLSELFAESKDSMVVHMTEIELTEKTSADDSKCGIIEYSTEDDSEIAQNKNPIKEESGNQTTSSSNMHSRTAFFENCTQLVLEEAIEKALVGHLQDGYQSDHD